jgi:hypothetical protein
MTVAFRRWSMLLAILIIAALFSNRAFAFEEQDPHEALRDSLKSMTGAELEDLLFNPPPLPQVSTVEGMRQRQIMEMCRGYVLSEMIKREKEWSVPVLEKAVRQLRPKALDKPGQDVGCDLALLTALRRAEGAADPLMIVVNGDAAVVKASRAELPVLKVALKNVDKEIIFLGQEGQSLGRWRAVIKDKDGSEAKANQQFAFGGLPKSGPLKPGQTWETELAVRDLVEPPPPGAATLQLLFHNDYRLAGVKDLSCLVVSQSKTLDLVVEKTVVYTSAKETELVHRLVKELDGDQPLKIIAGTYGEWAHGMIGKDTPAGQLLSLRAAAVPPLIDIAQDASLPSGKRAWLLSILFSLTGENDPRKDYMMLSSYSYVSGPWEIWTSKEPKPAAGTFRTSGRGSRTSSRSVDDAKLLKHAATWKEWLDANCEVREMNAE